MKYCKDCKYYIPKARYQFEMRDARMRECKHYSICNRIIRLVKKERTQQISLLRRDTREGEKE